MPSWLPPAGLIICALAALVVIVRLPHLAHWARSVRYSWTASAHIIREAQAETLVPPSVGQVRYGSMILAEERGLYGGKASRTFLPALHHEPDWRERTMAELAPEALDVSAEVAAALAEALNDQPPYLDGLAAEYGSEYGGPHWLIDCWCGEHHPPRPVPDDSGPGAEVSSCTPGPDTRLCGPEQPHEKPAGTESAGSGHLMPWPFGFPPEHPERFAAPEPSRLADTGDIRDAALLAQVTAELHRQDDDTAEYLSRLRSDLLRFRLDLTASLA
jgi:hypothetical protein